MHGHDTLPAWFGQAMDAATVVFVGVFAVMALFMLGVLPIPIGYDRGKVAFLMWCGTGLHAHRVYLTDNGLQTLHPADRRDA